MTWVSDIITQTICSIIIIIVGHQIYEFIKGNFTKRVVKDMYHMQVDKYNTIVTEIERKENMVNDLTQFLEDSIK
jgi:hypothetical protein